LIIDDAPTLAAPGTFLCRSTCSLLDTVRGGRQLRAYSPAAEAEAAEQEPRPAAAKAAA